MTSIASTITATAAVLILLNGMASKPVTALYSIRIWVKVFDNLGDYEPLATVRRAASTSECVARASSAAQLATFNETDGTCWEFVCRMGLPSCRKCRNTNRAGDDSLSIVWTPRPYADQCWTTVQHRVSDSVNFYRNWSDYKAGFGEGPIGNFWIGLNSLHALTGGPIEHAVRFVMKSWNGTEGWAQYSSFRVGPESDNYRLNISGTFTSAKGGNWDAMTGYSGQEFSTKDANHDVCNNRSYNCAATFQGAWWFRCCSRGFPNGKYYRYPQAMNQPSYKGIVWSSRFGSNHSLMEFEILLN